MDFVTILSIFVLACFVGYFVVWSVTPALHTPLMAVTNAISSVIIVGALVAGAASAGLSSWLGLIAIALAIIGIALLAYRAGYATGSDMAERDNRAEAR